MEVYSQAYLPPQTSITKLKGIKKCKKLDVWEEGKVEVEREGVGGYKEYILGLCK